MSANQLVLVIGGSRGTGLLIAQRLQRQGLPVRILARNAWGDGPPRDSLATLLDQLKPDAPADSFPPATFRQATGAF